MKLALVRRGYSPTGGAEAYLKRFAHALAAAGHEPVLYTSPDWPAEDWPFELHRLHTGRSPHGFALALSALDPRQTCDLVFSLERVFACDCYRAGDGVHAAWLHRRQRIEPFWKQLVRSIQSKHINLISLERSMFGDRKARSVIVNSRMVAQEIVTRYGYPEERIHLVYNGAPRPLPVEEHLALRHTMREELGLSQNAYVLLFAGSGWERKGLAQAILAVEQAPSRPTLLVAGSGKSRGLPLSERVRFLGPVPGLARHLAVADAFILPTWYDPFSNACLEALPAGLPVITTTANGFSEILTEAEGAAVTPGSLAGLVAAIDRFAEPSARPVEAIRARAAPFSVERNLRESLRILSALAD